MNTITVLTEVFEKAILLTLIGLSIWSVSIIIDRRKILGLQKKILQDSIQENLRQALLQTARQDRSSAAEEWCRLHPGFVAGAVTAALASVKTPENVDRSVASFVKSERMKLEKGLAVLATLGSNAPFIGLFGTVLGIIRAFAYLGSQSGSAAVMSGVSQALYATAVGLFVAIPAVVAFNIFSKSTRDLVATVDSLKDFYISQLQIKDKMES
jgi:biopolymer transport protein ExbB